MNRNKIFNWEAIIPQPIPLLSNRLKSLYLQREETYYLVNIVAWLICMVIPISYLAENRAQRRTEMTRSERKLIEKV